MSLDTVNMCSNFVVVHAGKAECSAARVPSVCGIMFEKSPYPVENLLLRLTHEYPVWILNNEEPCFITILKVS